MSYQPPPPPPLGQFAQPSPEPSGRMRVGTAASLGPVLVLGLINPFVAEGWAFFFLAAWMGLSFLVGFILALIPGTRNLGAGLLIGAAISILVAGGSCVGWIAMQEGNL